jgi:hypothetical protein
MTKYEDDDDGKVVGMRDHASTPRSWAYGDFPDEKIRYRRRKLIGSTTSENGLLGLRCRKTSVAFLAKNAAQRGFEKQKKISHDSGRARGV